MIVRIELSEKELRALVAQHLRDLLGDIAPRQDDVRIEVKSKQNYKSEWEEAEFRAVYSKVNPK